MGGSSKHWCLNKYATPPKRHVVSNKLYIYNLKKILEEYEFNFLENKDKKSIGRTLVLPIPKAPDNFLIIT